MFALRRALTKSRLTMSQQLLTSQKIDELLKFVTTLPCSSECEQEPEKKYDDVNDDKFYITTAINYTNGRPHIGHAYEAVVSDVIARYHRIYGRKVFFLTGTDEHGQKVANTAASQGFEPKEFCDENVAVFKALNEKLGISNDRFIRTTDADHYKVASKMFEIAYKNGDIYKSQYEGWYDVRNEKFLTETQAKETNYIDPLTNKSYTKQSEETYFFRMSKYQKRLLDHIGNNPLCISPSKSYQFIYRRLQDDKLSDLCVSRSTFKWGVPVPIDCNHIIYVWFDALSNYLTGIDYFANDNDNNYWWPANVHIIGKDIAWFHCVIWPCILMSCGIKLPLKVYCHGFVMDKNGEKMSKSVGNVVDPFNILNKYNCDSIRYFICTQTTFGNDMRWNDRDLEQRHDAHLAHIYGNLVNRALKLCTKNNNAAIPDIIAYSNIFNLNKLIIDIENSFKSYNLYEAAEFIMDALRKCNDWITKKEPWKLDNIDEKTEKLKIIRSILECIYILSHFMEPFTPNAAQQVFNDLNHNKLKIKELVNFNNLQSNKKIKISKVLFVQHSRKHERKIKNENKPIIARINFKIGQILEIKNHPKDSKLYIQSIDIGDIKPRIIVSGLAKYYKNKENLLNKKVIIFENIKYSKFKGIESQGMIMCVTNSLNNDCKILKPPNDTNIGEQIIWNNNNNNNEYEPDQNINIGKKNSFWKKDITPKLITDKNGNMAFDNILFKTKNGKPITSPFPNSQIS